MVKYEVAPFKNLFGRVYEKSGIKMKAYTAVQKKLLVFIYALWKKDEPFDPCYQDNQSRDAGSEPSFASVPQGPSTRCGHEEPKLNLIKQKTAPAMTRAALDKHPSTHRRMPSFA